MVSSTDEICIREKCPVFFGPNSSSSRRLQAPARGVQPVRASPAAAAPEILMKSLLSIMGYLRYRLKFNPRPITCSAGTPWKA